ncbi:MAG: hypothetical protein GXO93_06495 [FCB group bacterium]|nr:hypothetical protein [FCB group bacterium]
MFIVDYSLAVVREFGVLTLEVFPYFLIGTIVGALLEVYLKPEMATKFLGKGTRSVISASVLGAVLPGCACATIPMAKGLKTSGARLGTVGAFIMVSPLLSPHTLFLNYGMLGMKFTVARIIVSMVGAILLGIVFNFMERKKVKGFVTKPIALSSEPSNCGSGSCGCASEGGKGFWKSLWGIMRGLGKYFILGMLIASVMTTLIPKEAITEYIGSSGFFAYAVAALVGIPLYVCEGEEIPITLALLKLGLGAGPSFTFLLGSVGTCIPTIIMAQKIIGKRPMLLYIVGWFVFAISSGIVFQMFF